MILDAFHLPALSRVSTATWEYGEGDSAVQLRIPQLTQAELDAQIAALRVAHGRWLKGRPVAEIVGLVDAAAARFGDANDPVRHEALEALPAVTGYSHAMICRILDGMVADWRADRLHELLGEEFADPRVLDEFRPRPTAPGTARAFGPGLTLHVFSGNVPGLGVTSLIRALLVKSASIAKTSAAEPLLAALFARTLAEADPGLGRCLAVTYWPGGANALEAAALSAADAVLAYGGNESIRSLRERIPAGLPLLAFGHKLSFAVAGREALSADRAAATARLAAVDVATFDQQGCVSPHLIYAEAGGDTAPRAWAALLAGELERLEQSLPRGAVSPGEAAGIRRARTAAEFAGFAGSGPALFASEPDTAWTVIYEDTSGFVPSCLNRLVRVKPVGDLSEVIAEAKSVSGYLQTVGFAGDPNRLAPLANALGALGASRIAALGSMAWPRASWHHDGHPPLRHLVRWCDVEELNPAG